MLSIVCWKWGTLFGSVYVNRLRAMFARQLKLDHRVFCVTDDPTGIDGDIETVPLTEYLDTPRCRRRMIQYSTSFGQRFGKRFLSVDLDVVLVGDVTSLLSRVEPLVCWKVAHSAVYSGSWVLMNVGVLHPMWERFKANPLGFPKQASPFGIGSDQAMLNLYLRNRRVAHWTDADGLVTYYGEGYERYEHLGVGPNRPTLPKHARVVVLGSADKAVMDEARYDWVREHWGEALVEAA